MCGIAGIVAADKLDATTKSLLHKMCDVMAHRGPDDEGFYFSDCVGLGMRRLSIIDLSTGHQPLFNEDNSVAVILNGEIYNYRELRGVLAEEGHCFSTTSDTEVIVHLYEKYGEQCVRYLRGMFCFAIWDEKRQLLLVARDRVGIKQVYYSESGGRLLFGSEIKCILQDDSMSRRTNPEALVSYLTFLYVPSPATMFKGIHELPPAHYLVWEAGSVRVERYWQLEYRLDSNHPKAYYIDGLLGKLTDAVKSHLVSDVPLGAFLSGGLDSGTIVAIMSAVASAPVKTFTIGFDGSYGSYDEREDARRVAQRYQTRHTELAVRPHVAEVLPRIVWALDQPLADSSSVPSYYVCQSAREKVTVALSAVGGDELAGGYERYLGILLGDHYSKLPLIFRKNIARVANRLPDFGSQGRFSAFRLKRFVASADRDPARAYFRLLSTIDTTELRALLTGEWLAELNHFSPEDLVVEAFRRSGSESVVHQMLFADATGYLAGDLLPMTDRMSMIHSLEVRVPFLDHELLEFAASIPPQLKIRRLTKKYVLRQATVKLLPKEHFRKHKRGFSVPLNFWLRNELRPYVEEVLAPRRVAAMGYFDPARVATLLEEHFAARENHENKIWALLIFGLWHEIYLKGTSVANLACHAGDTRLKQEGVF
jgi:asparagine synthase (glutamine-hydrolysing)